MRSEIVEITDQNNSTNWSPSVSHETLDLIRYKGFYSDGRITEEGQNILNETVRIMEACCNPIEVDEPQNDTGLVIGYVQSGKTLSFTVLTALARDNQFQIIIIISGTSVPLHKQTTERLNKDLRLDNRNDRNWVLIPNPGTGNHFSQIRNVLERWRDPKYPNNRCSTLLLTVMKNGIRLQNLSELFARLNLNQVPVLIIDDEGDQASLNTRARANARNFASLEAETSTIYRRINELRSLIPNHTFLQYTATPQAPLFINILDRLSPNFIRLLTPGARYTGSREFFIHNTNLLFRIPPEEISTSDNPITEPPESLLTALRYFYLGVASGQIINDQRNRSMLVHPSRLTIDHAVFRNWIENIKNSWANLLSSDSPQDEEEKNQLLSAFEMTYRDLQLTTNNIPSFHQLIDNNHLLNEIKYTRIMEVNASGGSTPEIPWRDEYAFILVGGQAMDRGFTVEGLTVTYMPRNTGVGNVDTIQQRARFLGYKRDYLGYCRVFLDQPTIDAFFAIVEHEENVRDRLAEFNFNNRHLNEWEREVVLDEMLRLTRNSVIYDNFERDRFGAQWFSITTPHDSDNLINSNRNNLFNYLHENEDNFTIYQYHANSTEEQKHLVANLSLDECLRNLLNKLKYTRESDSNSYASLRSILKNYVEGNPDERCFLYLISTTDINNWTPRKRSITNTGKIRQLFQGRNPRAGEIIYPGDSEIKDSNTLTIQVHYLDLIDTQYTNVPTIAIWVPERMGQSIIRLLPNN